MKCRAHPNLALIKYWGKKDSARNLPATDSLAVTLDALWTDVELEWTSERADALTLNDAMPSAAISSRCFAFVTHVRQRFDIRERALVHARANFPVGAGLASSASFFAALALATTRAAGVTLSTSELSALARVGSASAARSVVGGFSLLRAGAEAAETVPGMDLRVLVLVLEHAHKARSSTDAMLHTAGTSPYYAAWLSQSREDYVQACRALAVKDLPALGALAEHNCLAMHAAMTAARPSIRYWTPATLSALALIEEARASGLACWFSIDAGPQVKVLCAPDVASDLADRLRERLRCEVHVCSPGIGVAERGKRGHSTFRL